MCIRDRFAGEVGGGDLERGHVETGEEVDGLVIEGGGEGHDPRVPVSYTHLRAHETVLDLVCRLLLEKKK